MKQYFGLALAVVASIGTSSVAETRFEDRENLLAFVGSIKSSEIIPCPEPSEGEEMGIMHICFDAQLSSVFTVNDVYFGDYDLPEITVISFDHFGRFPFRFEDHVLMYVSLHEGEYFQHKYQYDTVYPTKDGGWAGCGPSPIDTSRYEGVEVMDPQPIEFESPVTIDLSMYTTEAGYDEQSKSRLLEWYSQPSFSLDGDIVTCHMGLYVDDLFKLRDETILEARRRHQN